MTEANALPINRFKQALQQHHPCIGLWNSLSSPAVVELLGGAGFDWLLLDMEHSPNDLPLLHAQLQALAATPTTAPVVRPPSSDAVLVKQLLDLGVQNLLIPNVQNAQEAAMAVAHTRYPPHGVRGFASASRATRFGRVPRYWQQAQAQIALMVQVESAAALEHIEAIAEVDGVDGIFIGPGDLSASMGYLGEPSHPAVLQAIDDAFRRINAAGKPSGFLTGDEALAKHVLAKGATFVAVGADVGLLVRAADGLCARFRSSV